MISLACGARRLAGLLAAALLFTAAGCRSGRSAAADGQNPGTMETAADQNLTGEVSGTNWHIPWMIRDVRGRPVKALVADAREGEMNNLEGSYSMRLHGVRANLFQEGVHAADIQAAQVDANSEDHLLIGTGGVRVTSLTSPPDTVVTADKITWDPRTFKLVAVGNARVVRRPPNGSMPVTQTGGRITFDTKFQKIEVDAL